MTYKPPEAGPHILAVMDRLRAKVNSSIKVGLAVAQAPAKPPYIVVYPDPGYVDSSRLCQTQSDISVGFLIHAVGTGPEQCMWVMDAARSALLHYQPLIPGRKVQSITQSYDTKRPTQAAGYSAMTRDFTTQPPVFLQVAEFTISSQQTHLFVSPSRKLVPSSRLST